MQPMREWTTSGIASALLALSMSPGTVGAEQVDAPPERIAGKPNLNGLWQAMNTAHWNIEAHSAEALTDFWQLGAIAAIPAGQSVVLGETIPYRFEALQRRNDNREAWPAADPEAKCYLPGIPRATYMPFPFQIVQGQNDILFAYEYASANRLVHMRDHQKPPVDSWMGWSNGRWEGDTLVIEVTGNNDQTWFDRAGNHHTEMLKVTERYTKVSDDRIDYEVTIEDPATFTRPWEMQMPLYRRAEANAQLLEFKCVEFSEELLYGDLTKKESD
jgi:hypothetical protein